MLKLPANAETRREIPFQDEWPAIHEHPGSGCAARDGFQCDFRVKAPGAGEPQILNHGEQIGYADQPHGALAVLPGTEVTFGA